MFNLLNKKETLIHQDTAPAWENLDPLAKSREDLARLQAEWNGLQRLDRSAELADYDIRLAEFDGKLKGMPERKRQAAERRDLAELQKIQDEEKIIGLDIADLKRKRASLLEAVDEDYTAKLEDLQVRVSEVDQDVMARMGELQKSINLTRQMLVEFKVVFQQASHNATDSYERAQRNQRATEEDYSQALRNLVGGS